MKRLLFLTILAFTIALIAPVGRTAMQDSASSASTDTTDLAAMGEQIEIMRLVLTRSINTQFSDMLEKALEESKGEAEEPGGAMGMGGGTVGYAEEADEAQEAPASSDRAAAVGLGGGGGGGASMQVPAAPGSPGSTTLWSGPLGTTSFYSSQYTSHTRGFYTPGFGVYFTTEVNTPTSMTIEQRATEEEEKLDAWEEAARQVQGQVDNFTAFVTRSNRSKTVRRAEIADAYVDAAIDAIINAVGEYGLRLDQLPDDESIAVGLRFEPGLMLPTVAKDDGEISTIVRQADSLLHSYVVTGGGSVQQAKVRHVVIQVSKSEIRRLQNGQLNRNSFRDRVTVTSY